MAESPQDLERLLLGFHQTRRVCANAVERVRPLGAGWALGVEPERGRVEKDSLALDLLDDRALGEHVLEAETVGQPATHEVEAAQLRKRMVFVAQHHPDSVFGREIAQKDRDDQGVGLVTGHLHEAGRRRIASRSAPAANKNSPRRAFSSNARCWWLR